MFVNFLIVLFCLLAGHAIRGQDFSNPGRVCPPPELIRPCTCQKLKNQEYVDLSCGNIQDENILEGVLDRVDDYEFGRFLLDNSALMYLPAKLLNYRLMNVLWVYNSTLGSIFDSVPPENQNLKDVYLDKTLMQRGVDWKLFSNLKNVTSIRIRGTPILKLGKKFAKHAPKSLESLSLEEGIKVIEDGCFAEFANLQKLYIRTGQIKHLTRTMFPPQSKIWYFDFSNQQLSSLPNDMFSNMPNIRRLILQGNLLTSLPEEVFQPVMRNIQIFDISNNQINCKCSISWIVKDENHPEFLIGSCKAPMNLNGKSIVDLDEGDFIHC